MDYDNDDLQLPTLPHINKVEQARYGFDARMAFELALGVDDNKDVLDRYGVTALEFAKLSKNELFRQTYKNFKREIRDKGTSFRVKAKIQAEQLLDNVWDMIQDPLAPASTRLEAMKSVVRWADLEPEKKTDNAQTGGQFNIQINLGDK